VNQLIYSFCFSILASFATGIPTQNQTDGEWQENPQKLDFILGRLDGFVPFSLQRILVNYF
jgi:hypothetical protein